MGLKYKLTDETIEFDGKTLHRIEATSDFGDVKEGDKGGFVESENNLSHSFTAWIYDNGKVMGSSRVFDYGQVRDNAIVKGDSFVYDSARLIGDAMIEDNVSLGGYAIVGGNSIIKGRSIIYGNYPIINKKYENVLIDYNSAIVQSTKGTVVDYIEL